MPFLLAFLAAYLANPWVTLVEHWGFKRSAVVGLLYLGLLAVAGTAGALVTPVVVRQVQEFKASWPERSKSIEETLAKASQYAAKNIPNGGELTKQAALKLEELQGHLPSMLPDFATGLLHFLSLFFLVPFLAFFFLLEGPAAFAWTLSAVPGRKVEMVLNLFCSISESLGNYLRALFMEASTMTLLAIAGFFFLGVDYSIVLGIMTGVSGLIPYIGPAAMGAVSAAIAFIQFGEPGAAVKVLIMFGALRFIDDRAVQPLIMSKTAHLHPALLLLALMVGGHFFGIMGLIFAAPAACVSQTIAEILVEWYLTEWGLKRGKPPTEKDAAFA